jgi:tetratricopeptide (TPR) repeat protein
MNTFSMWPQPSTARQAAEQQVADARAADDPAALATALLMIGDVDLASGAFQEALSRFDEALVLARRHQLPELIMQSWGAIGRGLYYVGDYRPAHNALQRALQQALQHQHLQTALDVLLYMGLVEADAGDVAHAMTTLEHAVNHATAQQDTLRLGIASGRLGQLLLADNQPEKAGPHFNQALVSAFQLKNPHAEIQARLGLGQVYLRAGKQIQAMHQFEQATAAAETLGEASVYATVLGAMMRTGLAGGQAERVMGASDAALVRAVEGGSPETEAALLVEIGTVWVEQEAYARALGYLLRAVPLLQSRTQDGVLVALQSTIGMAQFQLGELEAAYATYHAALELAESLEIVEARAVLHGRLSSILTEQEDFTGALEQAEQAVALVEGLPQPALQGELYMVLAFALFELARQAEAIGYARRAHELLVAQQNEALAAQVALILTEWEADAPQPS